MIKQQKLKHCAECHDDFYNHGDYGLNGECWSLKTAKLIKRKKVHINQRPPWNQKAEQYLNCYHGDRPCPDSQKYVYIDETC